MAFVKKLRIIIVGNEVVCELDSKCWTFPEGQDYTSKKTSINSNKMPKAIKVIDSLIGWGNVGTCLDLGGGRFNNALDYLQSRNVQAFVYDPYNRSDLENKLAIENCSNGRSDVVMINNVLNVISPPSIREKVVSQAANAIGPEGVVFAQIYEGNQSGVGRQTGADQFQANLKTRDYLPLFKRFFLTVEIKKGLIVSRNPL